MYGKETTGQQNLAALPASCEIQRRRTYNDRIINTFDVCFIGYVRGGKISRAYEYVDTGQLDKFLGPR